MAATVIVRVQSDAPTPARIEGLLVRVLLTDGTYVTEGTTNSSGEATFVLPDATYDLLFYKLGVSVVQPQRIVVDEDEPVGNTFLVEAHVYTPPESLDSNLCRVSGTFIDITGHATRDAALAFATQDEIMVVSGRAVSVGNLLQLIPDENGYLEFDLIRTLKYDVFFYAVASMLGKTPAKIEVIVPDAPSVSLDRLLFPVPTNFGLSEATKELVVGDEPDQSVLVEVTYSDGNLRTEPPAWGSVVLNNSDETVVEAILLVGKLQLRALTAGTATITAEREISDKAVWLPDLPAFTADSLAVTVT